MTTRPSTRWRPALQTAWWRIACAAAALLAGALLAACSSGGRIRVSTLAGPYAAHRAVVCILPGEPPPQHRYVVIARVSAVGKADGEAEDLLAPLGDAGRRIGADAIIRLHSEDRIKGTPPEHVSIPTVDGMAVKLTPDSPRLDCQATGGHPG